MQTLGGVESGKTLLTQLKANGLKIYDTNGPMVQQLLSGANAIAAPQNTKGVEALIKKEAVRVVYPKGVALLPSNYGLSAKNNPEVQAAV